MPSLNKTDANANLKSAPTFIGIARRHVMIATKRSAATPDDLPTIKARWRIIITISMSLDQRVRTTVGRT